MNMGVIHFDTRVHGPCQRPVNTGVCTELNDNNAYSTTIL